MTNPVTVDPEQDARRSGLRRAVLNLVIAVVLLDVVALALFYGLRVGDGPDRTRTIFVAIWTFSTAITVAFLLRRVRLARRLTVRR